MTPNRVCDGRAQEAVAAPGGWRIRMVCLCCLMPLGAAACAAMPAPPSGGAVVPVQSPLSAPAHFHFLRGYLAELANDGPVAAAEYRAALRTDPASVFLRVRLAMLQFLSGAMQDAEAMLDRIPPVQVGDAVMLTQMAKIYAGAGRPDRAMGFYDEAIRLDPDRGETYLDRGLLLLNRKQAAQAEEMFARGIALMPRSHLGYFYRGQAMEAQGRTAGAKEHYLLAVMRNERFEPAYQALVRLYESEGDVQAAVKVYERFVASGHPRAKPFRRDFMRMLSHYRHYEPALKILEQMIAENPGDFDAHIRKAMIHAGTDDAPRAVADLTQLVQAHPSNLRVRDSLGLVYEHMNDFEKAMDAYRINITMDAAFYDSRIHLGLLLYRLKRFDEALPHLRWTVAINPRNAETHLLLGLNYLSADLFEQARAALETGLVYHPDSEDLRFHLGAAYDKLNRFPDVVREMEAVLAINPDHADALNYLGYSYADRGINGEEAVHLTQRAVALKPDNGSYVDSLGWALFKVGRVAEALEELKRAAQLMNDDPVIFEHLGEIYLRQNHHEKAREAWSKALTLDPKNEKLIERFHEAGFETPSL